MFGRQAPADKGIHSLRGFMRYGVASVLAAGMSLSAAQAHTPDAGAQQVDGQPFTKMMAVEGADAPVSGNVQHPNINSDLCSTNAHTCIHAEVEAFQNAYSNLYIVPIYPEDSFELSTENGKYGFNVNQRKINDTISAGLKNAGNFYSESMQWANTEVYLDVKEGGKTAQQQLLENAPEEITQSVIDHFAKQYIADVASVAPNVAADPINFYQTAEDGSKQATRACIVRMIPEHVDREDILQYFGVSQPGLGMADVSVTELKQLMTNHELAHCVLTDRKHSEVYNEVIADVYAVARHMQHYGSGSRAVESYLDIRQISAVEQQDAHEFNHDVIPFVKAAIPQLKELADSGRLQGLNPYELTQTLQQELPLMRNGELMQENYRELKERSAAVRNIQENGEVTSVAGHYAVNGQDELSNQIIHEYNQALTNITGYNSTDLDYKPDVTYGYYYRNTLKDLRQSNLSLEEHQKAVEIKQAILASGVSNLTRQYSTTQQQVLGITGPMGMTYGDQYTILSQHQQQVQMSLEENVSNMGEQRNGASPERER